MGFATAHASCHCLPNISGRSLDESTVNGLLITWIPAFFLAMASTREAWDPGLLAHMNTCVDAACGCRTYKENFEDYRRLCVLCDEMPTETWLWHRIQEQKFYWVCIVCNPEQGYSAVRRSVLKKHHHSKSHKLATAAFASREHLDAGTPPIAVCEALFHHFRSSASCSIEPLHLSSGPCGKRKARRGLWCLAE